MVNIVNFLLKFQEASSSNLTATQAIKTEDVHCFPGSLKAIPQIRHDHFLPDSLQTITDFCSHAWWQYSCTTTHSVTHVYIDTQRCKVKDIYVKKSRGNFSTSMPSKYFGG